MLSKDIVNIINLVCWFSIAKLLWPLPFTPVSGSYIEWFYYLFLFIAGMYIASSLYQNITEIKVKRLFFIICLYLLSVFIFGSTEFELFWNEYKTGQLLNFLKTTWGLAPSMLLYSIFYNVILPIVLIFLSTYYYKFIRK